MDLAIKPVLEYEVYMNNSRIASFLTRRDAELFRAICEHTSNSGYTYSVEESNA